MRKVNKYSMSGEFICQYPSVPMAEEAEHMGHSHINDVCRGSPRHHSAGGFKWKYVDFDYNMSETSF